MSTKTNFPRPSAILRPTFSIILTLLLLVPAATAASFTPNRQYLRDQTALDELQQDVFRYMWEDADPETGMAYEANFNWDVRPAAVGGTGFGVAAIVCAVDRGWITREQAVARIMKITLFLRDKSPRNLYHGAFPHWINTQTGEAMHFGTNDAAADIVETSLLMQGLLIARAYFNGPGMEEKLRSAITTLWEDIDWNFFTAGEESGVHWHWDPKRGHSGLKMLGYNECLITYVLAISSPTHPISRAAYDYWTSGANYQPRDVFGYRLEATAPGGGPLFLTHYSFIGLDPRLLADDFVREGYFVRGVKQTLSNRGYCLQDAPAENKYSDEFWGLSASQVDGGYTVNEPYRDTGTVAPTAALSSMPYTPHYSMRVLRNFQNGLRKKVWGKNGPYDAVNLRDDWVSDLYLAIDQLPIVCMVENYRSGLLWRLLMSDPDVRAGLMKAGLRLPDHPTGFPEAVVTLLKENGRYVPDAHEIRRHPDTGKYAIPFWCREAGQARFAIMDQNEQIVHEVTLDARKGPNQLQFPQFMLTDGQILTVRMVMNGEEHVLPVRLH